MNRVDGYGVYQDYGTHAKNKKEEASRAEQKEKTERAQKAAPKETELSSGAKALLEKLKKKYSNMDFFVADYASDEEAKSYLSRGSKQYSVLVEPDLLERMAADEETKNKYMGIIDGATEQIDEIKEQLGGDAKDVTHVGFTVGGDGKVSFFADLEKSSESQRKRMEASREEKRANAKREEKKAEKEKQRERLEGKTKPGNPWERTDVKRATVQADSVEELVKKIREIDWDAIRAKDRQVHGGKFDFSI